MRLAFFASLCKMSYSQGSEKSVRNSIDVAQGGESSSDFDRVPTAAETRFLQSPGLPNTRNPLKIRDLSRRINSNKILATTTASTSAETQAAPKYDHDSFLEASTFASYKELILRES